MQILPPRPAPDKARRGQLKKFRAAFGTLWATSQGNLVSIAAEAHPAMSCLVVGQQVIVPKNLEHSPNELSLIVVADLVAPHWLSSPIRS
jgi:hypothetical protein